MGVPKFFRYISERYPCLSEFVKEYQIPIFDNLYLDMNGIIHMCSHPDDNNPHFRITEEKLFADIFHYIEVLFRMIRPQKVFFMAIDGVAPRAKMNQQRGRRFRSAKDAEKAENEAKKKGEKLPDVARFDSNCITPGTEFMAKLHEQLKYFVVSKISTDKMWSKCTIILSGHETPGEGEHKIMDYIRYIKSQPGYDPNTRHCLYGLDADLIMLGLCTHDPHFSLLREEVKFGKKSTKRVTVPEEIRFYLLHLSLMREYLELEFTPLKNKLKDCSFEFDLEKIIDDWILMGFLVGNDFIPNLPNLHISNGALPILYNAYMEILPTLDGYINEAGTLHLERFEKFMRKLGDIDLQNFEEIRDDMLYLRQKTGRTMNYHTAVNTKSSGDDDNEKMEEETKRKMDPLLASLIQQTDELDVSSEEDDEEETSSSDEDLAFKQFKDEYYRNKLEYHKVTRQVMQDQAEGYVRAIQWNLNYYYNGVCSWSWYYPHHYAPYISDIKGFSNLKIDFELGKPFKPYEQLLAVLPAASKNLLPECYHKLMTDESSLIKSYYPENFQTDLNGKKQEWEAVVLVPFIDENILLEAMKPCNDQLTPDEIKRNTHGPMLVYKYVDEDQGQYRAPAYFPTISPNFAHCTPVYMEEIRVPKEKLIKGVYPGAKFDVFYPGFPTMKHLKYQGELKNAKVKVFEQNSRNENMILKIAPSEKYPGDTIPENLLGKVIWVGWPHLVEAKVLAVSNAKQRYEYDEENKNFQVDNRLDKIFNSEVEGVSDYYFSRMGVAFGKTEILVHVKTMTGRKYVFTQNGRISLEKQFTSSISNYPIQSIVEDIKFYDDYHSAFRDITDVFPKGSKCFTIVIPYYGYMGTVMDSTDALKNGQLKISLSVVEEPNLEPVKQFEYKQKESYFSLAESASCLAISNNVFSRITGSLFVEVMTDSFEPKSVNIGLDLKFNKKNQETPGYTKKINNYWYYSQKTIDLVKEYHTKFPQVFNCLQGKQYSDSRISAKEIFGPDADETIKTVQNWLKTLISYNMERRICNSVVMEPETIKKLEEVVDSHLKQVTEKTLVLNYKPHHLYKPEIQTGNLPPDSNATHEVFDRVINVREGYTVPLGYKGTIIAKHEPSDSESNDALYDIVFDKPFAGGMTLNCSENRGYRLSKNYFINISHGKREMEGKTGRPGELRARAKERQNINSFQLSPNQNMHNIAKDSNSAFAPFNKTYTDDSKRQLDPKPSNKNNFQFMSDFGRSYNIRNNKENTVKIATKEFHNSNTPKNVAKPIVQAKPQVVDTEFLKKVLKIDSNVATASTSQNKAPDMHNVKQQPPMIPLNMLPMNGTSATARLLSYYQMNSLGCPRYTYFDSGGGISAQLVLPDQKVIVGREAKTREEASENVAKEGLIIIERQSTGSLGEVPPKFPVPPSKWVRPNVQHTQPNKPVQTFNNRQYQARPFNNNPRDRGAVGGNRKSPTKHHHDDKSKGNKQNFGAGASSTFVPLQVIKKRQISIGESNVSQSNLSASSPSVNNPTSNNKKPEIQKNVQKKEVKQIERKPSEPKKTTRKTRIAANFVAKNSS